MKLLHERILVSISAEDEELTTSSGIILTEAIHKNTLKTGTVVLASDDVDIEIGTKIYFQEHVGQNIDFNESPHLLMDYDDIVALD